MAYILAPVDFGGAEKVNLVFLGQVDRTRFDVIPILLIRPWEKSNPFISQLEKMGYHFHRIPVAKRPREKGRDFLRILRTIKRVDAVFSSGGFDLAHTHGYFADIAGGIAAKRRMIPMVSTCHGFIFNNWKLKVYNIISLFFLQFFDRIIAVSEKIKSELIRYGIKPYNIKVIVNAVPVKQEKANYIEKRMDFRINLGIRDDEFVLGYVGRLSIEKGVKFFLEACSMLNIVGLPLRIILVGDGPSRAELEALAEKRGIRHLTFFSGFQKEPQAWLSAMDVFVLPSLTEGTPMALLEAMALGIPVVASNVGGIPSVITTDQDGVLVPPGDSSALKDALYRLWADVGLRRDLSIRGKEIIERKYDARPWARVVEGVYQELVACPPKQDAPFSAPSLD